MTRRVLLVILVSVLAVAGLRAADDENRDGNWWRSQTTVFRVVYVVGIMDGMAAYQRVANAAMEGGLPAGAATEAAGNVVEKMINGRSSRQMADGLTAFYEDYRNRAVRIDNAFVAVAMSAAGATPEQVDAFVLQARSEPLGR